nr:helix-turn-helix transcriptional regulator [uncultured Ruminococcus sp.]
MNFGQNLQQHRKDKGLSQEALANQLFVTRQSVSQWENDRTMPSVDLLLKLNFRHHGGRSARQARNGEHSAADILG